MLMSCLLIADDYFSPQAGALSLAARLRSTPNQHVSGHVPCRGAGLTTPEWPPVADAPPAARHVDVARAPRAAPAQGTPPRQRWSSGARGCMTPLLVLLGLRRWQPFPVDFGRATSLGIVTDARVHALKLAHVFADTEGRRRGRGGIAFRVSTPSSLVPAFVAVPVQTFLPPLATPLLLRCPSHVQTSPSSLRRFPSYPFPLLLAPPPTGSALARFELSPTHPHLTPITPTADEPRGKASNPGAPSSSHRTWVRWCRCGTGSRWRLWTAADYGAISEIGHHFRRHDVHTHLDTEKTEEGEEEEGEP
ncbi:hypothetical protein DFH07DRAFT_309072 [Mycena maculata]|uniref:Uncharacterized protein n=1 Tax=Mycena maculata TaxID=230809 RepID=A0AAD7HGP3_9AGAR|nr:hypothetical protein DFH07DRAFT_309072 [Mycena maculata]